MERIYGLSETADTFKLFCPIIRNVFFLFYTGIALKFFMKSSSLVRGHLKNNTSKIAEKYFKFKITSNIIGKLIMIHPYELMSS